MHRIINLILSLCLFSTLLVGQSDHTIIIQFESVSTHTSLSYTLTNANSNAEVKNISHNISSGEIIEDSFVLSNINCFKIEIEANDLSTTDSILYKIWYKDSLIFDDLLSSRNFEQNFFCNEGETCEGPQRLIPGNRTVLPYENVWYKIKPNQDTYYDIRTISDCDTEMWLYDNCQYVAPNDQTGAIIYNNDLEDRNSGFTQILLEGETSYFLRIRKNCSDSVLLQMTDLKLKKGCLDPKSCNFDPLANLDSGNCIYDDCNPDLIVDEDVLKSSIRIDSIINDNECLVVEGCLSGYGKRDIVRFSTTIKNIGDADFIVGEPIEESSLFSSDNCHNHWHYLGYAEYLLFDSTQQSLPIGVKNGFCALDYECSSDLSYKYNCDYMGISAGCQDTYESDLLCQWIDITDVPAGIYTLVVRVNYVKSPDFFGRLESDFDNNWAQVGIEVLRNNGLVNISILEDWATYRDCLGIVYGDAQLDCQNICMGGSHYGDINNDAAVDSQDLEIYWDYISNDYDIGDLACYDLSDDQKFTVLDYLLLNQCISTNKNLDENSPYHEHCEFPYGIYNNQDTTELLIGDLIEAESSFALSYTSNADIKSIDLNFSGVEIDSIVLNISDLNIESVRVVSAENRLAVVSTSSDYFKQTSSPIEIGRIYYNTIQSSVCIETLNEVVNSKFETAMGQINSECLKSSTTSTQQLLNEERDFTIYPNPSKKEIFINPQSDEKLLAYEILNIEGQRLIYNDFLNKNASNWYINHNLPSGFYLLNLTSQYQKITKKMVVQ